MYWFCGIKSFGSTRANVGSVHEVIWQHAIQYYEPIMKDYSLWVVLFLNIHLIYSQLSSVLFIMEQWYILMPDCSIHDTWRHVSCVSALICLLVVSESHSVKAVNSLCSERWSDLWSIFHGQYTAFRGNSPQCNRRPIILIILIWVINGVITATFHETSYLYPNCQSWWCS